MMPRAKKKWEHSNKTDENLQKTNKEDVQVDEKPVDSELIRRLCEGDKAAFQELYERWEQGLWKFCRYLLRYLREPDKEAEDVVQDAFLKLWLAAENERLVPEKRVRAWLYRVARNCCLDRLRKEKRHPAGGSPPTEEGLPAKYHPAREDDSPVKNGPEGPIITREALAKVKEYVSSLPEPDREICRLKFEDDLKQREIAELLDVPESKVSVTIKRVRQELKEMLSEDQRANPSEDDDSENDDN